MPHENIPIYESTITAKLKFMFSCKMPATEAEAINNPESIKKAYSPAFSTALLVRSSPTTPVLGFNILKKEDMATPSPIRTGKIIARKKYSEFPSEIFRNILIIPLVANAKPTMMRHKLTKKYLSVPNFILSTPMSKHLYQSPLCRLFITLCDIYLTIYYLKLLFLLEIFNCLHSMNKNASSPKLTSS